VRTSLSDQGWLSSQQLPLEQREIVDEVVGQIRYIAESLPTGSVVRRDVDTVHVAGPRRRRGEPPVG
jgi:hypothetical protein